ncbi:MAG: hypothetical protein WBJ10_12230, partial [Daejeonella sp.]|uniref:hypothetical protein n=1 Tax=Daejeonella sp. TaxID=2805397 RepID=UPI003C721644
MKTEHSMNGGLRSYVSILPVIFPAIVLFAMSTVPLNIRVQPGKIQMDPTVARVKDIYTSQIGIREKQPNSGPEVEKYLKYVNLPKGNPWCAAFVCWVYGKAGVGNPKSGWTPDLFKERRVIWSREEQGTKSKEQRLVPVEPHGFIHSNINGTGSPRRFAYPPPAEAGGGFRNNLNPATGDIFGLYFPEKRRIAHVGFIDQWDGTW